MGNPSLGCQRKAGGSDTATRKKVRNIRCRLKKVWKLAGRALALLPDIRFIIVGGPLHNCGPSCRHLNLCSDRLSSGPDPPLLVRLTSTTVVDGFLVVDILDLIALPEGAESGPTFDCG